MGIVYRIAFIQVCFLSIDFFSTASLSWHGYNQELAQNLQTNPLCDSYHNSTTPETYLDGNQFGLWPGKDANLPLK
jgi:hypothetical protein